MKPVTDVAIPRNRHHATRRTLRSWLYESDGPLSDKLARVLGPGSVGQVPQHLVPDTMTTSVCGFCATGCGLSLHLRNGEAVNVSADHHYPVNRGSACPKGWEALSVLEADDRATVPLLRLADGTRTPVSWQLAMTEFCDRFRTIQRQYGPESIAFLGTGQLPTEELALLGGVAKFGMGMVHGDGNTRQCMATAATAYKQSFGFDAPPYTYQDFEESDVIVLVGSNLCVAHPIMWERICRNRRQPTVIVIDPRRTDTAVAANLHLQISPKSDLVLFNTIARQLIETNGLNTEFIEQHTTGFENLVEHVSSFSDEACARATGLSLAQINSLTQAIRGSDRVSFWWTMGVNQSYQGVRTAQSLINLALMTGNIGRPGTGANSITGQCNAMGSRLFSNTTCLYGGRDFEVPEHRREVAQILGIEVNAIPTRPSWPYHKILDGIRTGDIRGLWIVGTNPAHSWIDQHASRALLAKLDFLVVQDMYHSTETAQLADLLLPAAGWGEKQGTFINSERRIGLTQQVRRPPGEALSDFSIFRLIAHHWGCGEMFSRWTSPGAAFTLLKELAHDRPCDFSGIDGYATLSAVGGVQWPCRENPMDVNQHRRLFEDGKFLHADGRAKFICDSAESLPEPCDTTYPYVLLTGRGSVAQWHTQTRTAKSPVLRKMYPSVNTVDMHPRDAAELGLVTGDVVTISSRRGAVVATVILNSGVGERQLFIAMHDSTTNQLTLAHFDPYSHQPSFKDCAVRVDLLTKTGVRA